MKKQFAILCSIVLFGVPVLATTVRSMSVKDLVKRSDTIVKGQIVGSSAFYDPHYGMNYTTLTIRVDRVFKATGKVSKTLKVTLPGGTVDGRVQVVFGVPVLKVGETAILFLHHAGKRLGVVGLGQGVFIIDTAVGRVFRRLNRVRLVGEEFKFPTDLQGFENMLARALKQ